MNLLDEYKKIINGMEKIYIFGIGEVGLRLFYLLQEIGEEKKFKGFIVTKGEKPPMVEGFNVYSLKDIPVDSDILVSVSKSYHPEVYKELRNEGFENIVSGHKYFNCVLNNKQNLSGDVKTVYNINADDKVLYFKKYIQNMYVEKNQAFGDGKIYQSLPLLSIDGLRPTDIRINEYGIYDYITKDSCILDIGCNCGFFDIELANDVNKVVGLDVNETLIEIGIMTAKILEINNIFFICDDYNNWEKNNCESFDMIFSFSVHLWLDISPEHYAEQLYNMLNKNGHIIFESHKTPTDSKYREYVKALNDKGLRIVRKGKIKDDKIREREYVILEK